jgi:hypothetical protein
MVNRRTPGLPAEAETNGATKVCRMVESMETKPPRLIVQGGERAA